MSEFDEITDESVDAFVETEMSESAESISIRTADACAAGPHKTAADYGNEAFLKLRECDIDVVASTEFGQKESTRSWDVYTRYARFYDLIQFSSLKKQFISNAVDVRLYSLCSDDIKALSRALMQNKHVTAFDLSGNEVETTACRHLSDLLANNRTIERLVLSRCKIGAAGAVELAKVLGNSALTTLNMSRNRIERAGLESVLNALRTNTCLKELDLSDNGIRSERAAKVLSTFVETNKKLETLNLSKNSLNKNTDLSRLVRSLSLSNETLQVLILRWNGMSGEANANVFKNLMIKTNGLQILDLGRNDFKGVGKVFGQGIKRTTRLEHLDLSDNPLTAADVVELLKCVVASTSLRSLGLTHVLVDEEIEQAISKARSNVPDLDVRVGLRTGVGTDPVDLQTLYLQRLRYLGLQSKKKNNKIDIGQILLKMRNEGKTVKRSVFLSTFEKLKINDAKEVINELAKVFMSTNKRVDVTLMSDKYLELYLDSV